MTRFFFVIFFLTFPSSLLIAQPAMKEERMIREIIELRDNFVANKFDPKEQSRVAKDGKSSNAIAKMLIRHQL